jgi:hypothetical protein
VKTVADEDRDSFTLGSFLEANPRRDEDRDLTKESKSKPA